MGILRSVKAMGGLQTTENYSDPTGADILRFSTQNGICVVPGSETSWILRSKSVCMQHIDLGVAIRYHDHEGLISLPGKAAPSKRQTHFPSLQTEMPVDAAFLFPGNLWNSEYIRLIA